MNTIGLRHLLCIINIWVIVYVENTPDRVVGEVIVACPMRTFLRIFLFLLRNFHQGLWNAMFFGYVDLDPWVAKGLSNSFEILRLGLLSFADN